ncbi:MAG: hypothetical protein HY736_07305 [Verrucomicrobia bacterium]|nr:hypothetical protein [Verrucomicrobiota bacterium]
MVIDAIRELNRAAPFRPYALRLASGTVHRVPHPDFIAVAPKGSWVMVSDENDHPHWISALLIEEVTPLPSTAQTN